MTMGLVGRKIGMSRIFTEDGGSIPVTVIDVSNNRVTQLKTPEKDTYAAVQIAFGTKRPTRVSKAKAGHYAKAGVEAGAILREFRVEPSDLATFEVGKIVPLDTFSVGQKVDVSGVTIGKGFSGVIKRHNFSSNRASHGNSISHNRPGSTGQNQDPGRVFPGKKMAGHYGDVNRTIQNLEIIRLDPERQLILVKGAIPGAKGGHVIVRPAVKARA